MIAYTLTDEQFKAGTALGKRRQQWNMDKGRGPGLDGYADEVTGERAHCIAACVEIAFSFVTGLPVNPNFRLRTINEPAVPPFYLYTTSYLDGHLIVRLGHYPPRAPIVFCVVMPGDRTFEFRGWIRAYQATLPKYWPGKVRHRPAYWVPQGDLRSLKEITDRL